MKGTEKIIAHIQADAQAQADAILAQAEQQCADIRQDYEKKASELYAEKIRAGVKACQDQVDSGKRIGLMEARKAVLALKQEMVSRSFDLALKQIVDLPADKYVPFLAKLAAQASVSGDEEIVLNARDKAAVGEALVKAVNEAVPNGKLRLAQETGDFAGGLLLRRGNVEANCSAELLVDLCRGEMSSRLASVLFE